MTNADEHVRLVMVDGDDREVTLELRVDARERLRKIAVVRLLEEMDDDLGVGLGGERVTALGELLAQVEKVNAELNGSGRVLVRPSGTEPVVRVLAEAETPEEAEGLCARIAALVTDELG